MEVVGQALLGCLLAEWGLMRELLVMRNVFLLASPAANVWAGGLVRHLLDDPSLGGTGEQLLEDALAVSSITRRRRSPPLAPAAWLNPLRRPLPLLRPAVPTAAGCALPFGVNAASQPPGAPPPRTPRRSRRTLPPPSPLPDHPNPPEPPGPAQEAFSQASLDEVLPEPSALDLALDSAQLRAAQEAVRGHEARALEVLADEAAKYRRGDVPRDSPLAASARLHRELSEGAGAAGGAEEGGGRLTFVSLEVVDALQLGYSSAWLDGMVAEPQAARVYSGVRAAPPARPPAHLPACRAMHRGPPGSSACSPGRPPPRPRPRTLHCRRCRSCSSCATSRRRSPAPRATSGSSAATSSTRAPAGQRRRPGRPLSSRGAAAASQCPQQPAPAPPRRRRRRALRRRAAWRHRRPPPSSARTTRWRRCRR
jgi:hypothetical protein